jgi:hypothetical protein
MYTGRDGYGHRGRKLTPEAKAWKDAVALFARGATVAPETDRERKNCRYRVEAHVFYGPRDRGDSDNFGKAICDGLVHAGVIHSDVHVDFRVVPHKDERDDPRNPRTDYIVERLT